MFKRSTRMKLLRLARAKTPVLEPCQGFTLMELDEIVRYASRIVQNYTKANIRLARRDESMKWARLIDRRRGL